jgi:hypothetical protein
VSKAEKMILMLIVRLAGAMARGNFAKIQTVAASVADDAQKMYDIS